MELFLIQNKDKVKLGQIFSATKVEAKFLQAKKPTFAKNEE